MKVTNPETIKLVSAPSGNPPSGAIYQWYTTDGINTRTSAGVDTILANREQNVIVNGGFDFNQRGTNTAVVNNPDDTYGPDRWVILSQTADVGSAKYNYTLTSFLVGPFVGVVAQGQATAQRVGMLQIVESQNSKPLRGQTVALQASVDTSSNQTVRYAILEWTGTTDTVTSDVVRDWTSGTYTANNFFLTSSLTVVAVGSTATTGTPVAITLSGVISTSCNNLIVFFWTEATMAQSNTLRIGQVDCHIGAIRSWSPRPIAEELVSCQRYYEKTYDVDTAPGTNTLVGALAFANTVSNLAPFSYVPYKVSKRYPSIAPIMYTPPGTVLNVAEYNTSLVFVANRVASTYWYSTWGFGANWAACNTSTYSAFHFTIDTEL